MSGGQTPGHGSFGQGMPLEDRPRPTGCLDSRATMKLGVPKETAAGETRVAVVPDTARRLAEDGVEVLVERGAGEAAAFPDSTYEQAGARLLATDELYAEADVVCKVQKPSATEIERLRAGQTLIALLQPLTDSETAQALAERGVTAFSMDSIPRVTRAQPMDALSSQSTVAGYKAAILAAERLGKFFPMLTTAAGTIPPAKVLVLGAGVAGLQAIATARRLGAIVSAFDVRPVVKEQVESLGAGFLELDVEGAEGVGGYAVALAADQHAREQELIGRHAQESDAVITTALVPGRAAPILLTADAVRGMRAGAVVVDVAAEQGGNCEATEPGTTVVREGVTIVGLTNLPATMPTHASQMYSRNIQSFLGNMLADGEPAFDFEDEIVRETCVTHEGRVLKEPAPA
jgi:H+-translocating NAD(P) transhydrogenase subunit alpha